MVTLLRSGADLVLKCASCGAAWSGAVRPGDLAVARLQHPPWVEEIERVSARLIVCISAEGRWVQRLAGSSRLSRPMPCSAGSSRFGRLRGVV